MLKVHVTNDTWFWRLIFSTQIVVVIKVNWTVEASTAKHHFIYNIYCNIMQIISFKGVLIDHISYLWRLQLTNEQENVYIYKYSVLLFGTVKDENMFWILIKSNVIVVKKKKLKDDLTNSLPTRTSMTICKIPLHCYFMFYMFAVFSKKPTQKNQIDVYHKNMVNVVHLKRRCMFKWDIICCKE